MLSDFDRMNYFKTMGLCSGHVKELEYLRQASPMRKVGKSALTNMVTHLYSQLMKRHLVCESRTCEALAFMQLEHEGDALEIYPQVEMRRVERVSPNGHRTISTICCDAMVLKPSGIVFLECKYEHDLERLYKLKPEEWKRTATGWSRPAAEKWAEERGCKYEIWTPPTIHGYLWANLEVVFPMMSMSLTAHEERIASQIEKRCTAGVAALCQITYEFGESAMQIALVLIARRRLYATLSAGLLTEPQSIQLSTDRERIERLGKEMLDRIAKNIAPLDVNDPLLSATTTDYQKAELRLARVNEMIAGRSPLTRRFAPLVKAVRQARDEGKSLLAQCLTHYHLSGTHDERLTTEQIDAVAHVIKKFWDTGVCKRSDHLHGKLEDYCKEIGLSDVPSKTTLRNRVQVKPRSAHDIATGGNRAFHAARGPSDPTDRSVRALFPFHVAHVDATKFDHRSAADTAPSYPFSCPVLYSAIDGATGEILGRSLSFGPPSRFGLGLLFRDIVSRHGRFPLAIIADRGSEIWSRMTIAFAAMYQITLHMRPAGAARFGSQVETALREINSSIAHRLVGTTLPDQKGRSVDPRFKSYKTARLAFRVVVDVLDHFLFTIWPTRPIGALGAKPEEKISELQGMGVGGRAIAYNHNFELATSVPIEGDWRVTPTHAIGVYYRDYTSKELQLMLRERGRPDEVRLDCAKPAFAYVKFGSVWVRAYSNKVLTELVSDELDRIFERLYTRDLARQNRELRKEAASKTQDRVDHANASAPASADVQPRFGVAAESTEKESAESKATSKDWAFDEADVAAFEEYLDD